MKASCNSIHKLGPILRNIFAFRNFICFIFPASCNFVFFFLNLLYIKIARLIEFLKELVPRWINYYNLNWKYFQCDCLRDCFPSNWWLINTCIWKLAIILFINWQLCETYLHSEISSALSFLLAATLCFFLEFVIYKNCAFDWIFKRISAEMNKL